ncbi:thioredoxin domain-containing protein [Agrobacterium rosae]
MTFRMMAVIVVIALGCVTSAKAEPVQDLMNPAVFQGSIVGQKTAPVTLVVYSSPTCSHCVNFHERDLAKLQDTYVAAGK